MPEGWWKVIKEQESQLTKYGIWRTSMNGGQMEEFKTEEQIDGPSSLILMVTWIRWKITV